MKPYDVQSVMIERPPEVVFGYVADPKNLPAWTSAFKSANRSEAVLKTPQGEVAIALETVAVAAAGSVDWHMTFPDGSDGWAHSRVVARTPASSIYTFVLHAPPVPLERLEGALEAQKATLAQELIRLKEHLEA
jgi:uncharacterized protein YndB with AHSA1/START domain